MGIIGSQKLVNVARGLLWQLSAFSGNIGNARLFLRRFTAANVWSTGGVLRCFAATRISVAGNSRIGNIGGNCGYGRLDCGIGMKTEWFGQ